MLGEVLWMETKKLAGESESGNEAKLPRKILVVDDQRVIADTLTAILKASGCACSAAYSGEDALKVIAAAVPDLMITDVSMPGMNGVELAVRVRQEYPKCKVLLFSGHSSANQLLEEAHAKGHDFTLLHKPIHPRDLLECLKTTI